MDSSIRVLHVDVDTDFLERSADRLEGADERIEVLRARRVRDAVDRLESREIDCVVSGYRLEERTGIELLETTRDRDGNLPFILFTGAGSETVASEAISAGVTDYLTKGGDGQFRRLANSIVRAVEATVARRRVHRREREYRTLVDAAPVPFVVVNEDVEFLYLNSSSQSLLGVDSDADLIGESAVEFLHPDDEEIGLERLQRVFDEREPVSPREYRIVDSSGETRHVRGNIVPATYDGRPAAQLVLIDITERKRRAQKLERQNERLDKFASVVSHDLRNPLNVAELRLEMAKREVDSENLDDVERAHARMRTLVDNLLHLAREGGTVSDPQLLGLESVVETCWQTTRTGGATLHVETETTIRGDKSRLRALFENMFRNAVEHAEKDTVQIRVGDLGDGTGFYVADDGPGIPDEVRDDLFEYGSSSSRDGTGFGLAIVREVVEAHGWEITVQESDAGGARFEIRGVEIVD